MSAVIYRHVCISKRLLLNPVRFLSLTLPDMCMSKIGRTRQYPTQKSLACFQYSTSPLAQVPPMNNTHDNKNDSTSTDERDLSAGEIISNLPPDEQKRLKILKLEYDVLNCSGVRVPTTMSDDDWLHILQKNPSLGSRKSFYNYLFKTEKAQENKRIKAAQNIVLQNEKRDKIKKQVEEGMLNPFQNTFLQIVRESTMNSFYQNNLCYARMNGPDLVFDFGFEDQMTDRELTDICRQIQHCHGVNKVDREPFHFSFCNLRHNGRLHRQLKRALQNIDDLPYTVTDRDYLEFYPLERLVYLSPDAPKALDHFNPYNDVYIVGGIVDRAKEDPWTFAKAKKEKLRTARFPLDQHVRWVNGSKALTLNHVVSILLDVKSSGNWEKALLTHLPKRKISYE